MTPRPLADPILMEVFSNRLLSITEEMGSNLIRASFSTNIKERRDCSVGLFDAAGRLIDACGLKGRRIGGAQISEKHANFIVNLGGASADDVLALMAEMRNRVFERFGIELEPEVRVIGRTPSR